MQGDEFVRRDDLSGTAIAELSYIKFRGTRSAMAIFKQFFHESCSALSYLIADPVTREAAVIDPVAGYEEVFLLLVRQRGLTLRYVFETHLHDDHLSAAPKIREVTGARLATHESAGVHCCDRLLRDQDLIYLGEECIQVLHTPGHTPCSVSLLFQDRLFSGDTLSIGYIEPLTSKGASAEALYDSVHSGLYRLPGETLLYPAHDRQQHLVSCIKQEKLWNRDLPALASREEFLQKVSVVTAGKSERYEMRNKTCGADILATEI